MSKEKLFESYLSTAVSLVQQYDGSIPLSDFLKQYFSLNKKFGSRDRKHVSHLCYCYYRLGQNPPRSLKGEPKEGLLFSTSLIRVIFFIPL